MVNAIACENTQPGDPPADWQITSSGDATIQGYATAMSVNKGQTVSFKIKSTAKAYHFDILRLGYYQGNGARKVATGLRPTATLPQAQPSCLTDATTGLIDCGNWAVSASWSVPTTAVSGIYEVHLIRDDTGGESQIIFVVRDDASHSDLVYQTSDETWQAYNTYGGNSLYTCTVSCPPGSPQAYKAAYKVSYNRPATFQDDSGRASPFYAETQMVRFLEASGYDMTYTTGGDVDTNGALLLNHKVFISSGHDEYWSGNQRTNVEAARDHGVSLAFFSGNEVFWKTRWEASTDGSNTPERTLVTYKETHFNAAVDPKDPPTWTGTWADPRFSPPADGGRPPNALTGQLFIVNTGTTDITVPSQYSQLRLWRNTAVANLAAGQSATLGAGIGTLGYEWDEDADDGFRPAGLIDMSSTTSTNAEVFTDYGSTTAQGGTATHHLTLYRAPSGALVFGSGTVQWSWGLDSTNPKALPADRNMQQATVNLFADMGAQPYSLLPGLVAATTSTDKTPPTSTITSPAAGANLQQGAQMTVSGTATDTGGGVVAGVEVSTDGGATWHPVAGTSNWSYSWIVRNSPSTKIETRATDDSGNTETPADVETVNVACPCSIFGATIPKVADSGDPAAVEVGVKFTTDTFGLVSGVRFYKASTNTGTHTGTLWSSTGQLLATATFTNETASGWQQVSFPTPVAIAPGTTYTASYFAPKGHYAAASGYFYPPPSPQPDGNSVVDSNPLHALRNAASPNGVFDSSGTSKFPTSSFVASNYWVDVAFTASPAPGQVTNVVATADIASATVTWTAPASGGPVSTYTITPYIGGVAQAPTTVNGTPPPTNGRVSGLTNGTAYTFTVAGSNGNGAGPASAQSNPVTPTATNPPGTPTGVAATAASAAASVSWVAPSNGGSPITQYTVTPFIGATAQSAVVVNGSPPATTATISGLTNGTAYTFTVTATNAVGTSPASAPSNPVTPSNATDTIFNLSAPAQADSGDGSSVELGVKFTSDVNGSVSGIRFYKASTNTGTHIGNLWSATGTLLASATFSTESASGWQQVTFANPVTITANTTYVASYLAPAGHYSATSAAFASAGVDNPPLHALANTASANGVYLYTTTNAFPVNTYNASNYWVDLLFAP